MSLIILLIVVVLLLVGGYFGYKKLNKPKPLDKKYYLKRWKEIQKLLANKNSWTSAVLEADSLLDEALKKRKLGGKSNGERLVKAQHYFTDNDAVWYGHKLRTKIEADGNFKPRESTVKLALIGIRQALKDLGALPGDQQRKR